ncbi:MAG: bifunctional preprotein translocase subunit SecD/SecF [bacterium ADurb.Bin243]|nr:MAG: bifunctional preprotein translocase subunit SecD/SecF [bacterium ADurb.Bin243]
MSISRVRSFNHIRAAFIAAVSVLTACLFLCGPAFAEDEFTQVWNSFISALENKDTGALNKIVADDAAEEFSAGISAQMKSSNKEGIAALKKMKYVKSHRTAEDIVKLGFEAASKIEGGEYLWVVLKKEKNGYKIFNFEPAYSLKFHEMKIKALTEKGQSFKDVAGPIVETLKKRLAKNKYTNFNFTIDYESNTISLEISGIDSEQNFSDFITRRGLFALRRVITANDAETGAAADELYEYPYYSKKNIGKYKVAKEEIITNEKGQISSTEVTFSGLRVPQVQIDLSASAKSRLESFTAPFAVGETEEPKLTLACVLDYKVLYVFKVGAKLSSGRFWVDDITLVQTAHAINSIIAAGPLPCPVEIAEFKEK